MKQNIRQMKRFFRILSTASSFIFQAFIKIRGTSIVHERKRAVLLRAHIEQLGSVFVKFGQFLSINPVLLPPIYCEELFYLLENVPPFAAKSVLKTFQEEFQKSPEELFVSFEMQPFAAASFGQVHKAVLPTGEKVVVKVQRPHIAKTVAEDIVLMKLFAGMIDFVFRRSNKYLDGVREFELWTKDELNYQTEVMWTEEYRKSVNKKRGEILAPKVYKQLSSKHIITTEYIAGTTLSKILLAIRNNDKDVLQQLKKSGFSRKDVSMKITSYALRRQYINGFFHGDPHPANIIFTKEGKLSYIDFGICGKLTQKQRLLCLKYARCFWAEDFASSFEALMSLCDVSKARDLTKMKKEFIMLLQDIHSARLQRKQTRSYRMKNEFQETLKLLQKYKVKMPTSVILYYRTAIINRNITFLLCPEMQVTSIERELKKISIINLLTELPLLFSREQRTKRLAKMINIFEKELTNTFVE